MSAGQNKDTADPLMEAVRLVGLWLYHFGKMEAALDKALARLFELSTDNYDGVTANIDLSRKVAVVRTGCNLTFCEHSLELTAADTTMKKLLRLNDSRVVLVHSPFEPYREGGVIFSRTVARQRLDRQKLVWSVADFETGYGELQQVLKELEAIMTSLVPYKPSFDFSDSRNSMYVPLIS